MKRFSVVLGIAALVCLGFAAQSQAQSCSYKGTSYACDISCSNSPTQCAQIGKPFCDNNSDGFCTICGGTYNDVINGTSGRDLICGKSGDDDINGADGNDVLLGDGGNDEIDGENGDDFVDGGTGNEWIEGGPGDDELSGGNGMDYIFGEAGNDVVRGGDGPDYLFGGEGGAGLGDVLCGDAGADQLTVYSVMEGPYFDPITGWDFGNRPNHCLDGGADQQALQGGDCTYHRYAEWGNEDGTATYRNCANPSMGGGGGAYYNSSRSCNCQ